eukprot:g39670.t1
MSNKRSNSFRRAIHLGNRRLRANSVLEETGLTISQRFIRHIAYETLPRELDRKWYYDSYTCCPPPWFMITVTLLQKDKGSRYMGTPRPIAIFVYYGLALEKWVLQITHPSYLNNPLVYHPQLRRQVWRYLSYIFMHVGVEHLGFNVVLQLLVGVPLEMVHGALRISFIYLAGILAGPDRGLLAAVGPKRGLLAVVGLEQGHLAAAGSEQGLLAVVGTKQELLTAAGTPGCGPEQGTLAVVGLEQGHLAVAGPERGPLAVVGLEQGHLAVVGLEQGL